MRLRFVSILAFVALFASVAMAHGDKKHVIGTLEKINADSIVVKTSDGKSVEVKLVASTIYVLHVGNEDKSAQLSNLTVGDRVVINATPNGETLEANEIKFSSNYTPGAE